MERLIIFANGIVPELESARRLIQAGDVIIAADGGTRHVLALGLFPSIVIGDLDSLSPEDSRGLVAKGVEIHQYPSDKQETDLELALHHAINKGYHEILVIGAQGGRLDQTVGNLSLLTNPELIGRDIRFDDGVEEAFITRGPSEIHGTPGDIVSLIPWSREVCNVNTEGLRWPLRDETLFADKTRGISNEMVSQIAGISHGAGLLLVIHHRQPGSSQETAGMASVLRNFP